MENSQLRIRPGFILSLLLFFVVVPLLVSYLLPPAGGRTRAQGVVTRMEERRIADVLGDRVSKGVLLPVGDNAALFKIISEVGTNGEAVFRPRRTNTLGEAIDLWGNPYHIESARKALSIRSAGKNGVFGDKDDVVFDSSLNDFVKP